MANLASVLDPCIQDLDDTISKFRDSSFQSAENVLERCIHQLDEEPMRGFLLSVLPSPAFSHEVALRRHR